VRVTGVVFDQQPITKEQLLNALVLAFRHSPMQVPAHNGTLFTALAAGFGAIQPQPGTVSLKGVCTALQGVPGYRFDAVIPALCRIKTWEPYLRMQVEVPPEFVVQRIVDFGARAVDCRVPDGELARAVPSAGVALSITSSGKLRPVVSRAPEPPPKPRRTGLKLAVAAVIILGLAGGTAGGLWAYKNLRVLVLETTQVSDEIPLLAAQRQGPTVTATLKDRAWLLLPRTERHDALERTWVRTSGLPGVRELRLVDDAGEVLGHARADPAGKPLVTLNQ